MSVPSKQIRSTIAPGGTLTLELVEEAVPAPGPHEVVVRVEAAPINPSDLGLLFGPADLSTARAVGSQEEPRVVADVPASALSAVAGRVGQSLPVGNEGAGVVVASGDSEAARALVGRTVSVVGGPTYVQYRVFPAAACQPLPEGTSAEQGASWFVNPMTALAMLETMRMEGHRALVHTAAASNLGQMLQRVCVQDGVPLVNIVRRPEQEAVLRELGAAHVVNSQAPTFRDDLLDAIGKTGATLAFDAIGGGELAGQILAAMEQSLAAREASYSRYGSSTYKQVYIYGALDRSRTVLSRTFGMSWGLCGWLLGPVLGRLGPERVQALRDRVVSHLGTTFASHYTQRVSLAGALDLKSIQVYGKQATGQKFLIQPQA